MGKIRNEVKDNGITLIALVVTIVVLLILAGITLNLVVGNNGIITKANDAKKQTIKAGERSAVDLASSYLKMSDTIDNTNSLNASNLKTEIEKNYGQNTVDVEGNIPLIATFKETGNKYAVNPDGTVIEMDSIEFELFYNVIAKGDSADIVLVPYMETNTGSTAEILCPNGETINATIGEETTYPVTQNGTYTFTAQYEEKTVTKQIVVSVISTGGSSTGGDSSGEDPSGGNPSGGGSSGDNTPGSDIDELPPNNFTPTATSTTSSITLSGSTTDNGSSGIKAYYFSIDEGTTWVGGTLATSYTFTGLTQATTYKLKMKAVDNAGNQVITATLSYQTKKVTELSTSNTVFSYNPTEWTKESIEVTITTIITEYTLQYSLDATNWIDYTVPVSITENGPIYARVIDSTGQTATGYATGNVTKIDKLLPQNFTPTATSTSDSITIYGSTTDAEATSIYGISGIKAYYFSIDNGATWEGGTTITNYTFTDLTQATTYNIKMKAVDNAENETITETIVQQTLAIMPTFTYTGDYEIVNDDDTTYTVGNKNWKIRLLSSGTLTMDTAVQVDVFIVGGGGGGAPSYNSSEGGSGGGGGYTKTLNTYGISANMEYEITIGAGGAQKNTGTASSAFGITANGGKGGVQSTGGNGGCGGGAGGQSGDSANGVRGR